MVSDAATKLARSYRGRLMRKLFKDEKVVTTNLYLDLKAESLGRLRKFNHDIKVIGELWS